MKRWTGVGVVAVSVAPLVLAALAMLSLETQMYVGAGAVVKITENDGTASADEVFAAIADEAERGGFDVAREVVDVREPETLRHLYVAVGEEGGAPSRWAETGHPDFSGQVTTTVQPLGALLSEDPRGYYYVFGPSSAARALEESFARLGLTGVVIEQHAPLRLLPEVVPSTTAAVMAVTALGLGALGIVGPALQSRSRAVARVHGLSVRDVLVRDLRRNRRAFLALPAAWAIAALAFALRGWAQWNVFVELATAFTAVAVVVFGAAAVVSTAVGFTEPLSDTMRGRRPSAWSARCIGALRIPAALLVVIAVGTAIGSDARFDAHQDSVETRAAAGRAVAVGISGSLSEADLRDGAGSVWERFGAWLQGAARDDEMILTAAFGLRELSRSPGPDAPVLIVDAGYLRAQSLEHVGAAGTGATIVLPESSTLPEDRVLRDVTDGLALKLDVEPGSVTLQRGALPQRLYTYATPGRAVPAWLDDAVLVVVADEELVRARNRTALASLLSTGDVVLADDAWARASLEAAALTGSVLSVQLVAQAAADAAQRLAQERAVGFAGAVLAAVTASGAAWASATARIRRHRRRSALRAAHGWSFWASNRHTIGLEALVAAVGCTAAWVARQQLAPDVTGLNLDLDPVVKSANVAFIAATTATIALSVVPVLVLWAAFRRSPSNIREELA